MCEFCTGGARLERPLAAIGGAEQARTALSQDAGLGKPPEAAAVGEVQKKNADAKDRPANDPVKLLKEKYGVDVREVNGSHEFYYRGGGIDNVVLRTPADANSLKSAPAALDKIVASRIASIEQTFKVTFAKPGEEADIQRLQDDNCNYKRGEMVHARQATLPFLHGLAEGLKHAQPSQMVEGGKEGVKIYLLDKQHLPDFYGGRKVQGTYYPADKDGKPAVFFTPAGQELPPTAKDTAKPGDRSVAWITNHEVNHNSQQIHWRLFAPDKDATAMGWEPTKEYFKNRFGSVYNDNYLLKGKNGEYYRNGNDACGEASSWFVSNKEGDPLNKSGKVVEHVKDAERFTNEQVMDRALVRPSTFYFMNPIETMAESLTAFKAGRESRKQLFMRSPELYRVTEEYDRNEISKFYGSNWFGTTNMMRNPDGVMVPTGLKAIMELTRFENELRAAAGVSVTQK